MKALPSRRRWRSFASSATTLSYVPRATYSRICSASPARRARRGSSSCRPASPPCSTTCRLRPKRLSGCGCFGLEQPLAHALAHAAVRHPEPNLEQALQFGEDDRAGRKRACSLEVDLRSLRPSDDRKGGELIDRGLERIFAEPAEPVTPQRSRGPAGCERNGRQRRRQLPEGGSNFGARCCELQAGWRIRDQAALRQPERAERHRAEPGRRARRADGDLRRAAADVADGDRLRVDVRSRERAAEAVLGLILFAEGLDAEPGCLLESDDQLSSVLGASPRRGDHNLDPHRAELPGAADLLAGGLPGALDLLARHAAATFDVFAKTCAAPLLPDWYEAASSVGFGDKQAQRVRANVDDGDPHPPHSARRVGGRPERPRDPGD